MYTGVVVSKSSQQRLVQRSEFKEWHGEEKVEEISVDGGKVRLRTPRGEPSIWRDYKAICLSKQGKVESALELFVSLKSQQAQDFCAYLHKHRHRIVNYDYYHAEQIGSVGSGAVESTIKQIDRRLKISGAQWKLSNVSQVLKQRCAYLNGTLTC